MEQGSSANLAQIDFHPRRRAHDAHAPAALYLPKSARIDLYERIFFAGEHTSAKWQGYMNGAVVSGLRAVEEISALLGN